MPANRKDSTETSTIDFEAKFWLVAELESQFAESAKPEVQIRVNQKGHGYGL